MLSPPCKIPAVVPLASLCFVHDDTCPNESVALWVMCLKIREIDEKLEGFTAETEASRATQGDKR